MQQLQLKTIKEGASCLGVQYRQLLDAVNDGTVPCYRIKKSRRLISVPEVLEIMKLKGKQNND